MSMSTVTTYEAITCAMNAIALRDEFAKAALQGCLSGSLAVGRSLGQGDTKIIAATAYLFADEMLKARTA